MNELTKAVTEFLSSLSDPIKLEIIKFLKNGGKTAKEIQYALNISQSYTSQQLKQLIKADIIANNKIKGLKTYYIKNANIFRIISAINSYVIEQHKHKFRNLIDSDNIEKLM